MKKSELRRIIQELIAEQMVPLSKGPMSPGPVATAPDSPTPRYRIDAGGCLQCPPQMWDNTSICPYLEPTCGGNDEGPDVATGNNFRTASKAKGMHRRRKALKGPNKVKRASGLHRRQ